MHCIKEEVSESMCQETGMDLEAGEALLQQNEHLLSRNELNPAKGTSFKPNPKLLKSYEILKSSLINITGNINVMFLMMFSTAPFFVYMVFYDIRIDDIMDSVSMLLVQPSHSYNSYYDIEDYGTDLNDQRREHFRILLRLIPFYLIFCPFLELFSLIIIANVAGKVHSGNKQVLNLKQTLSDVFYQKSKLIRPLITSLYVQFLLICTVFGMFWPIAHHYFITTGGYFILQRSFYVEVMSVGFHSVVFAVLFFKYLEWSALWNLGMVVSVLEEGNCLGSLERSAYYGKHHGKTGAVMTMVLSAYSLFLRLPLLLGEIYEARVGFMVESLVIWLVCFGIVVKWVAFVIYYYDCKAQTSLKKVDEEIGNTCEV